MDFLLLLTGLYLFTLIVGMLFEKLKIPWLFSSLLFGVIITQTNLLKTNNAPEFIFLGTIGMYFMLFLVGFELDLGEIKRSARAIIRTTVSIQIFSTTIWTLIVMALGYPFLIALVVGLSAHCVGEAVLLPILEELGLLRKKVGTLILGIGVLDDVFEVAALLIAGAIVASKGNLDPRTVALALSTMLTITFILISVKGIKSDFTRINKIEKLLLVGIALLFFFLFMGSVSGAEGLGAVLAGIAMRNFVNKKELEATESAIKAISYAFLGPIFFGWVGMTMDLHTLAVMPAMAILFYVVPMLAKIGASWISLEKWIGKKLALFVGIGLTVRFSTELVIAQFLLANHAIDVTLFTLIVASSILATVLNPVIMILFSKVIHPEKLKFTTSQTHLSKSSS